MIVTPLEFETYTVLIHLSLLQPLQLLQPRYLEDASVGV